MALASGYTQLEYIQSSGTQYIDTGFAPKNTSRVIMSFEFTENSTGAAFMCRDSNNSSNLFGVFNISGTFRSDFGTTKVSFSSSLSPLQKLTIDRNKNVCTIGSETVTNTDATFTSPRSLFLLASNDNGTAAYFGKGKLYSCKIYDNGTLIRDYIPCKNASGTVGLWDDVNSVFYTNAGTGTFTAGELPKGTHRTLIAGTGYDIKSGRVLIAGTGYDIKKGRTLIDGTGYDIKLGTPVAELAEGTIIKINESGSPVEFYVAKHDYESDLNGTGKTLVVRKDCVAKRQFDSGTVIDFLSSELCTWLNETYIGLLDVSAQAAISETTFYVFEKVGTSYGYTTGAKKVFVLSVVELGFGSVTSNLFLSGEGSALGSISPFAELNGTAIAQWTRTRTVNASGVGSYVAYVKASSNGYSYPVDKASPTASYGIRPIFTLPATTSYVDTDLVLI